MNMSKRDEGSANITPDDWERIARYLTGEAGSGEAEATERWVEADPHRVEIVQLLESVLANAARGDASDKDIEGALNHAKARFDDSNTIPFAPLMARADTDHRSFVALLRIAAAAIIIFGGTMLWQEIGGSRADMAGQTFATSVGERRQLVLKDGTKVLLGPTSRLVLHYGDQDGDRLVTLDGVAYFSVVHDPAHPFTVKAGSFTIQDVGTAFAVESDDSAGTRVVVDSGSVALPAPTQEPNAAAVLNARDRATVDMKGLVLVE